MKHLSAAVSVLGVSSAIAPGKVRSFHLRGVGKRTDKSMDAH